MKWLYVTVGLPRSGKTTWAQKQNLPIVCPDAIRYALHGQRFQPEAEQFVWAITFVMIRALFLAGNSAVVVDATNTTKERRMPYLRDREKLGYKVQFVNVTTPVEVCLERAKDDPYILPVIKKMWEQFESVDYSEGDSIAHVI